MIGRGIRIGGVVRRRRLGLWHHGGHKFPGACDIGLTTGARQQPVVADAVKAFRQNVEQDAPDELAGGEGHCAVPRLAVAAVILVPEGHAALVERHETAVRDGDAVGVTGEIGKHRFRPREGRLGIDKPVLPPQRRETGEGSTDEMRKYLLVDPASSKKKGSDYTVMAVIGLGADQNYYLLDAVRDRLNLTERCAALFRLHRKWRPERVGFERYGMLSDIEYIHEKQRLENYRFEIVELGGKLSKEDRIRRLIPIFESGRFYLPKSLWRVTLEGRREDLVTTFVEQEYKPFPVAVHDDMFDAISRISDPEIGTTWPSATASRKPDRYARAAPAAPMVAMGGVRRLVTGFG